MFAREFYELYRNELDVLFLGNSHLYYGVSPLKIYGDQKFVSFIIGSANQRMPISYYLLKQALLFQRPKLVVLEVSSLMNEYTTLEYPWERAAMFLRSPRCLLECANTYRCAVTNSAGTVYSNAATLTVSDIRSGDIIFKMTDNNTLRVHSYLGTTAASLTVPGTVEGKTVVEIGPSAFENHTELTSVDLPDSITVIGKRAFAGCTSLNTMT